MQSRSMVDFDVNKFLKKTFSEYDLERASSRNAGTDDRLTGDVDNRCADNRQRHYQRRAGSVPAVAKDIRNESEERSGGRRKRQKSEENLDQPKRKPRHQCAYCNGDLSRSTKSIYCQNCVSYFSNGSPSSDHHSRRTSRHREPEELVTEDDRDFDNDVRRKTQPSTSSIVVTKIDNVHSSLLPDYDDDGQHRSTSSETRSEIVFDCEQSGSALNDPRRKRRENWRPNPADNRSDRKRERSPLLIGRQPSDNDVAGFLAFDAANDDLSQICFNASQQTLPSTKVIRLLDSHQSRRSSWTSASSNRPVCRICHLHGDSDDTLVSPCRCSGTMQYVHATCLVHWLEISTKKVLPSPQCELCGYIYRTHHCYRMRRLHVPSCNHRDRILHIVFLFMILIMIGCAALSVVYLRQEKGTSYRRTALNAEDIIVIVSALLFFCAFFVAVFTQYRAESSLCRLCLRCWLINKHWRVKDYDRNLDYDRMNNC